VLLEILPDIAAKGCDELWLNPVNNFFCSPG